MFPILTTAWLADGIKRFEVAAPRIARKQRAGQFVIVRVHDHGERIPLTIAASDAQAGTITLVVQSVGKTTELINRLEAGDQLLDVVGPLGNPSAVRRYGTVVVIGGGVGAAIAYPTAKALNEAGNRVLSVLGFRTASLVILEEELRAVSAQLIVTTDDGSYGEPGQVTTALARLLERGEDVKWVLAIGPIPMMQAVAELTRPLAIPTTVSLNTIMVDGTGMCGGCRVSVAGESRFACVDGPEFAAHLVDFALLARRAASYRDAEQEALQRFHADPQRDLDRVRECQLDRLCEAGDSETEAAP